MTQDLLQRLATGSRVTVIRLRSLGDCVLTTPALALLKEFRPDLHISVVVEDRFAPVFANNPDVDAILPPTVGAVQRSKPQLTINLHGGSTSSQLTFASRARWRAGFAHFRFRALYNVSIPRAQAILGTERKVHTAEHLAAAMFFLGVPTRQIPRARLSAAPAAPPARPYAVIHPMASAPAKTWPAANFRAAAAYLKREMHLNPVFIAGPGESLDEFDEFPCHAAASLEKIKSLLANATMFLGNDSGPAHMAAAFGVPVVVLFAASDPLVWSPWRTESEVVLAEPDQPIDSITPGQVIERLCRLRVGLPR